MIMRLVLSLFFLSAITVGTLSAIGLTILASGLAILLGGVLVLAERVMGL